MRPYNEALRNVPLGPQTADAHFADSAYGRRLARPRRHRRDVPLMELPA
jgi:hypothetical protein